MQENDYYKPIRVGNFWNNSYIEYESKDKNYRKVRDHCRFTGKQRSAANSICNLRFNIPNKIPVVFHNSSNYDYNFIINELANEFDG